MTAYRPLSVESIARLRTSVVGVVLERGDDGYADEVVCFNTVRVLNPDVVVVAEGEADVAAAVRFAAENGLPVRVHATGHGPGTQTNDGLVISTRRLDSMRIDADARLAVIGAGVQWRPVVDAAADLGLAPVVGSSVTVGAVGYTLGGGLGPLVRSHGFSSDWVRGFRVVLASGDLVAADAHSNSELFWALRGGKGGFGIVTEMTVELAPLPALYAGGLYFEGAENIEAALRMWVGWLPDAPETVSTSVALLRMPDEESAPAPLRGKRLLHLRFALPGNAADGERIIAPLRATAPVYLDTVGELPLNEIATIHGDPETAQPLKSFCAELTGIDQELVTAILERVGPEADSPFVEVELRHLGSAAARDTADTTAVGGRDGALMLRQVVEDPALFGAARSVAADVFAAAARWRADVTNVNFAGNMSIPAAFEAAWPESIGRRLAELRAAYDPSRIFPFGPA